MKLQAVSHQKLYIQIADQIRDLIQSGAIEAGAQLPSERELAADLQVSRPTVREALIALEVAELVEVRVGVGAFVKAKQGGIAAALPEQSHSPIELMQVRRILEPQSAAMAASRIGDAGKARLRAIVDQMRWETEAGRWSAASDRSLHMTIAEGSGNAVLREIIGNIWASRSQDLDKRFHSHLASIAEVREHILAHHEALVRAVLDGEADAARAAMDEHLRYVETAMLTVWD